MIFYTQKNEEKYFTYIVERPKAYQIILKQVEISYWKLYMYNFKLVYLIS